MLSYEALISLTFVSLCSPPARKPLWVAFHNEKASSVPCGLATNQNWNTDRGNKGKEQSCSTNQSRWTNPAVFASPAFKSLDYKHTRNSKLVHLTLAGSVELLCFMLTKCPRGTVVKNIFWDYESTKTFFFKTHFPLPITIHLTKCKHDADTSDMIVKNLAYILCAMIDSSWNPLKLGSMEMLWTIFYSLEVFSFSFVCKSKVLTRLSNSQL